MKSRFYKILVILIFAALVGLFFAFDLGRYLTFEYLKSRQLALETYYAAHQLMTIVSYLTAYILVAALSLPGAAVMTLAGGAIFGFWIGLILVSFASTIGATLAFLVARFLLKDYIQNKFGDGVGGHLDEREPARTARRHVTHDAHRLHLPARREQVLEVLLARRVGEVADIQLSAHCDCSSSLSTRHWTAGLCRPSFTLGDPTWIALRWQLVTERKHRGRSESKATRFGSQRGCYRRRAST